MWNVYFWGIFSLILLLSVIFVISTDEKTNWEINFWLKILLVSSAASILSILVYTLGKKIVKARIRAKQRLYN
jgi:drug/metabolite transporter (DMT)-like permease